MATISDNFANRCVDLARFFRNVRSSNEIHGGGSLAFIPHTFNNNTRSRRTQVRCYIFDDPVDATLLFFIVLSCSCGTECDMLFPAALNNHGARQGNMQTASFSPHIQLFNLFFPF